MADVKKTAEEQVQYDPQYILQVKDLKKYFPIKGGMLNKTVGYVKAVDGVTFNLKRGTTMGLVGESGCGKTTTGRTILRLSGEKTGGQVLFNGQEVYDLNAKEMRDMRTKMQIIFQDPFSSLQPRMPVGEIIGEAVREHGLVSKEEFDDYIDKVMDDCGLQSFHKDRYPHEFSGGQRQRICIARALALKPEFIVCDEPVSALDVSIQAQIINLLKELQEQYKFTYLFISHDLSVVEHISDTVGVMYLGNLVEYGATEDIFKNPLHPYTKALFSAIPVPDPTAKMNRIVLEGSSAVNESALTGESIPVDKAPGDGVSAATVNQSGYLRCRATRVGQDTTLSQIIRMVSDAAATKAPIAKIADKVSGVFVPAVISIAAVTTAVWLLLGHPVGYALARGISVLVISCPCALGLATPVAIMVGSGLGAKNGILFKTAASLEETGRVQIVALDKTGTITSGQPRVTDILPAEGVTEQELLTHALALEQKSEHPLARAVLDRAAGLTAPEVSDFQALPGNGLTAVLEGKALWGGSAAFTEKRAAVSPDLQAKTEELSRQGKTPLFFGAEDRLLGVIAVADVIKEDSPRAVRELRNMGIRVVMLTGDNRRTAQAIGAQAGVDQVIAGVLPEGKEAAIRRLMQRGKVAMVGDGINDAPALTRADTGIAIGAGADVAIDAADVVLMNSSLLDVPAAIRLSRATLRNIHENLFWAFFYNAIGIPLAAGVFIPLGLTLNPMFGAAAMSLSSFCVVSNALRLNLFKLRDNRHDHKRTNHLNNENKEEQTMEKTLEIKGMMCPHCEATVRTTLEAMPQVQAAQVSHESGTAVVTLTAPVEDDVLRRTVEDKGYTVTAIR